ncbi:hypothetical protein UFOVP965_89 [uncultured Caudovirales phage]|uniref:Uncharacterized protein n=1 Tax=uncultured Caudovirales phage TaxID=2100421 RepID=A0A6J5RAK5_9CAUD|nr:hypothetical protein UFOVP965_89 [uncultured Caudovirales phage]CAB4179859.1 hypothetical protein UFOVP1035_85 [uncultured Caudovirales phage]CAB4188644.1 hypothetical protein UFOVP1181_44 [uncultured Caudovirales phage]
MSFLDPIVPEPRWGVVSPNVEPDEWNEPEEDD